MFFVFCLFSVFPCLVFVWFFLCLPEEELTLLFLLHCENGDFSVLMKDISVGMNQSIAYHTKIYFGICSFGIFKVSH